MKCTLCERPVAHYSPEFHRLTLNDERSVDVCDECAGKLHEWHGAKLSRLFPTKRMKNLYRSGAQSAARQGRE